MPYSSSRVPRLLGTLRPAHVMPPKKRSYPWQENMAREFRLRVTSREAHGGVVDGAVCRFCKFFGRDVNDGERKRKCTTRSKHWNGVFCSDNIRGHMVEQHPIKFAEYTALMKQSGHHVGQPPRVLRTGDGLCLLREAL